MSLSVTDGLGRTRTWSLGESAFSLRIISSQGLRVVKADGDELRFIRDHFRGIPLHELAVPVAWSGDDAAFVINNLIAYTRNEETETTAEP